MIATSRTEKERKTIKDIYNLTYTEYTKDMVALSNFTPHLKKQFRVYKIMRTLRGIFTGFWFIATLLVAILP